MIISLKPLHVPSCLGLRLPQQGLMDEFFALLILIFLSGVFSGSEVALVSPLMGRVESLVNKGLSGAEALYRLRLVRPNT